MCDCSICLTFSLLRYMLLNKFLFKSSSHNNVNYVTYFCEEETQKKEVFYCMG